MFTRSGEVTVRLELVQENLNFSAEEVTRFEHFHHFLFTYVLRLDKEPMKFSPSDAPASCLVIPVQTGAHLKFLFVW